MSDQDAQDINQMMSSNPEVPIVTPKKSKFIWIVLGCMVLGVGLGVGVYQQSISTPVPSTKPTSKPAIPTAPSVEPRPVDVPVLPQTNVVTPAGNSVVFPKAGKVRIYTDLNNIQLLMTINIAGVPSSITIPNRPTSAAAPMNFGDSTFDVTAGSTANFDAYLNDRTGPKMKGWAPPLDTQKKDCGVTGGNISNNLSKLTFVQSKLAGETIFLYQCWEDDDTPAEYNDIYMVWTYAPGSVVTTSPSPSATASTAASSSPSPSPSRAASPSPSPSRAASPSPSPSVKASVAATPTPTPVASPRVSMPDTTDGTPVTGIFEITLGTISVGIVFLLLGLLGLLVL